MENDNLEHDGPTPDVVEDRVCAENRWARVMDEFVVQSSRYNTLRSLLQAHYGGVIQQSPCILPLWSTLASKPYEGIRGTDKSERYASYDNYVSDGYHLAVLLSAAYGGIHMSAWNATFPTRFELQAWRACCLFLAVGPITTFPVSLLATYLDEAHSRGESEVNWACMSSYAMTSILVLLHCCAKVFIVVESFISLRRVPIGVYWTPMWLQLTPHV